MAFQWLDSRIAEERERREREARALARLPGAFQEISQTLSECIDAYTAALGVEAAQAVFQPSLVSITVRERRNGAWEPGATVEITPIPSLPGLRVENGGDPLFFEIGLLAGDKLFYKDGNEFITLEELTRRILDRALFPHLGN